MPDKNGWHDTAFIDRNGVARRWHYCATAGPDTPVVDTLEQRNAHERACRAAVQKAKKQAERERLAAATARLRSVNKLRKEARVG